VRSGCIKSVWDTVFFSQSVEAELEREKGARGVGSFHLLGYIDT
jgi:hypothetical protein